MLHVFAMTGFQSYMPCCTNTHFTCWKRTGYFKGSNALILLLARYITPNLFSWREGGSFSARASGLTSTAVSSVSLSHSKCTRCCNSHSTVIVYWGEPSNHTQHKAQYAPPTLYFFMTWKACCGAAVPGWPWLLSRLSENDCGESILGILASANGSSCNRNKPISTLSQCLQTLPLNLSCS